MGMSRHRGYGVGLALSLGALLASAAARAAEPAEPVALSGPGGGGGGGARAPRRRRLHRERRCRAAALRGALRRQGRRLPRHARRDLPRAARSSRPTTTAATASCRASRSRRARAAATRSASPASATRRSTAPTPRARRSPRPTRSWSASGRRPSPRESEPNDAAVDADALAAGGLLRGTLGALDVDRYATASSGGDGLAVSLFPLDPLTGAPLRCAELDDTRLGLFAGAGAPFARGRRRRAGSVLEPGPQRAHRRDAARRRGDGLPRHRLRGRPSRGPLRLRDPRGALRADHGDVPCDIVAPLGRIDRADINAIFAASNTPASGAGDPRDFDGDGTITVLDGSQCKERCTFARCATSACGLLGAEPLVVLGLLAAVRRRRSRARYEAEASR